MNPVFWILVLIGIVILWLLASRWFGAIGMTILNIFNIFKGEEEEENNNE